jgi:GntR family transcriptional repressor for pyruvate dehydrogenase complex
MTSSQEMTQPRARNLTGTAQQTILQWIREGQYPVGSQLPSVNELTEKLQVSRTVVREALQALVGMNLIEVQPGRGCFVKPVTVDIMAPAAVVGSLLGIPQLIELAQACKVLEGGVAHLAVQAGTPDDFDQIEEKLAQIERAALRGKPVHSMTPEFHVAIARATHNGVLVRTIDSLNSMMAAAGDIIEKRMSSESMADAEYRLHARLYEVLRTRDADAARREMESHIDVTIGQLENINAAKLSATASPTA